MAKAEYKSSIRSKRLIREAFIKLATEKDIRKISVSEIVRTADINRGTFYSHYTDIENLLHQMNDEVVAQITSIIHEIKASDITSPTDILLQFSSYLEQNLPFFRVMFASGATADFTEKLQNVFITAMKDFEGISEDLRQSQAFLDRTLFFAGGISNLYEAWFAGKTTGSLSDIAHRAGELIQANSLIFSKSQCADAFFIK